MLTEVRLKKLVPPYIFRGKNMIRTFCNLPHDNFFDRVVMLAMGSKLKSTILKTPWHKKPNTLISGRSRY